MKKRVAITLMALALVATACTSVQGTDTTTGATSSTRAPEVCSPELPDLAQGKPVIASMSLPDQPPDNAVDGDPDRAWGSGAPPEQWIEIDLGEPMTVTCVRIQVEQSETGRTIHRINGGAHTNPGRELATLDGETDNLQWLEIEGDWEFQFLRITTLESPSPVSWTEIEVR